MVVTIVDVAYNDMKKTIDEDFNNDVLVASLRIKMNQFYRRLTAYFPMLPEAKKTAIPFRQVVKAEQDKKSFIIGLLRNAWLSLRKVLGGKDVLLKRYESM